MDDPLNQAYNDWENDGSLLLLAYDLIVLALEYADWDILVRNRAGERIVIRDSFTCSLDHSIMNDDRSQQPMDV